MKAALFYGSRDVRVEEVELPELKDDQVQIEVAWCGICGSDKHGYERPTRPGARLPYIIGHEFSGTVVKVGANAKRINVGDRVVANPIFPCGECDSCKRGYVNLCRNLTMYGLNPIAGGAMAEYTNVPEFVVEKIPDNLPLDEAAVVEPAGIAFHALRISSFKPGDDVAVFGAGPIGLLQLAELKAAGAKQIFCIAHSEARQKKALEFGATCVLDPDKDDVVGTILAATGGGVMVSFDLAGANQTLDLAIKVLKPGGSQVVYPALPGGALDLNVGDLIRKEANIIGSQCTLDEFKMVPQLIAKGSFDVKGVITKKIYLDDIVAEGYETLMTDKSHLKILITPNRKNLD